MDLIFTVSCPVSKEALYIKGYLFAVTRKTGRKENFEGKGQEEENEKKRKIK